MAENKSFETKIQESEEASQREVFQKWRKTALLKAKKYKPEND